MNTLLRCFAWCIFLILFPLLHGVPASAQSSSPILKIRLVRPEQNQYYRVYFTLQCPFQTITDLSTQQVTITQDGKRIESSSYFIYRRPAQNADACFGTALVFDRSNLLPPNSGSFLAEATRRFVGHMIDSCQRATLISFSNTIDIHEFLTSDTARLRNSASALEAAGTTRTYDLVDGIQAAMMEMDTHGADPFRVIIAFTTGDPTLSDQRIDNLLASIGNRVYRIFIVTTASSLSSPPSSRLTRLSGGDLISNVDVSALPSIYNALGEHVARGLDEFQILYESPQSNTPPSSIAMKIECCNDSAFASYTFPGTTTAVTEPPAPHIPRLVSYPQPVRFALPRIHILLSVDASAVGAPMSIRFTDMLGRMVRSSPIRIVSSPETDLDVDLSDLPPGMYACHATIGLHHITKSIVISP
jgi:hypothetical protein